MNKSETIDKLAQALSESQAELKPVQLTAVNKFLGNKYATLADVITAATPAITRHGLAVTQLVEGDGQTIGVHTMLLHASGQWIESFCAMALGDEKGKSKAQVAGSVVTYLRRYAFASILGMYSDEETDGHVAGSASRSGLRQATTPSPEVDTQTGEVKSGAANGTAAPMNGSGIVVNSPQTLLAALNKDPFIAGYYDNEQVGIAYTHLQGAIRKQLGDSKWQWPKPQDAEGWKSAYAAAKVYATDQRKLDQAH